MFWVILIQLSLIVAAATTAVITAPHIKRGLKENWNEESNLVNGFAAVHASIDDHALGPIKSSLINLAKTLNIRWRRLKLWLYYIGLFIGLLIVAQIIWIFS